MEAIEKLRHDDVRAVGVGVPSVVDFETGRIRSSVNIPLEDVPLRELLTERVGMPVFVDNDASCAALAEAFEDGHFTCPDLVMFTIGTGVGGGTVLGGSLYRGATGAAPEIGRRIIGLDLSDGDESPDSDFPQRGSLESLASGKALDRLALDAARRDPESFLGRRLRPTARSRATIAWTARRRATRPHGAACASSASGSASASPTRSTSTTRSRS